MKEKPKSPLVSVILPCLNEEESVKACIQRVRETLERERLHAEVIVVDNGSTDRSAELVRLEEESFPQLRLTREEKQGYGNAYLRGFAEAKGEYVYMADMDCTYDFSEIPLFIKALDEGNDLVIGNRFSGNMRKGSMPWLHRRIGNPLLSLITRRLFRVSVRDIHCGARAVSKSALDQMMLYTGGMEFASEMVIKAARLGQKIGEVPVSYDKRSGASKLRSFPDGWRHLRFMLLYSPLALFLLPGLTLCTLGAVGLGIFYFSNPTLLGMQFYVHPMFLLSVMVIAGYQLCLFSAFSKVYAITHLREDSPALKRLLEIVTVDRVCVAGILIGLSGGLMYASVLSTWVASGFGSLDAIKNSIVALTLLVIGTQTFFSAFMISTLGIKER